MKVPHLKNMYKKGNPGYKPRFKPSVSFDDIGGFIVYTLLSIGLVYFVIQLI